MASSKHRARSGTSAKTPIDVGARLRGSRIVGSPRKQSRAEARRPEDNRALGNWRAWLAPALQVVTAIVSAFKIYDASRGYASLEVYVGYAALISALVITLLLALLKLSGRLNRVVGFSPWWLVLASVSLLFIGWVLVYHDRSTAGKSVRPRVRSFAVDKFYVPSGSLGDVGDVEIGTDVFSYEPLGRPPHEWDYKYVKCDELNQLPAKFGGVVWLSPPNVFGTAPRNGWDLRGFDTILWEARALDGPVKVEFFLGGIDWIWEKRGGCWARTRPKYADTMTRVGLGIRTLTGEWQTFRVRLTEMKSNDFKRVVGGFGWIVSWGNNGIQPDESGLRPLERKQFRFQVRSIRYEKE